MRKNSYKRRWGNTSSRVWIAIYPLEPEGRRHCLHLFHFVVQRTFCRVSPSQSYDHFRSASFLRLILSKPKCPCWVPYVSSIIWSTIKFFFLLTHYNKLDLFQSTSIKGWLKSAETITKNWGVWVNLISLIPRVVKILEINLYNPRNNLLPLGGLVFILQC